MGKKNQNSDLGRAIANKKKRDVIKSKTAQNTSAAQHAAASGRHTTSYDDRAKLQSVLDATDLEELMLNATMANEEFAAERYARPLAPQTVVVTPLNPNSANINRAEKEKRRELDRVALRIPRRPSWHSHTTPAQLIASETEHFLEWRRNIASIEEQNRLDSTIGGPMMTPFEKNLEVWRQLWRVVERSDVVVQIVDARNPLLYYCEDLNRYVTQQMARAHVLLLNKSDLLSSNMITKWQAYFAARRLDIIFFSAFKASLNESTHDSRVIGTRQLIDKLHQFERKAPQTRDNQRLVVGMCGYPNVGKSSTINVLLETMASLDATPELVDEQQQHPPPQLPLAEDQTHDASTEQSQPESKDVKDTKHLKRVAVSATPGKTKHFQTLVLSDDVMLCDCPGLVFPNFSSSKAELICAGVLSIDQMRGNHLSPIALVADRIPAAIFEGVYGIRFPIITDTVFTDADQALKARKGHVSATTLLDTHARARGFMTDHDRPDQSRSTRVILKDYVGGRINFTHAPPPRELEDGESGIGPAVHAKKGKLVHQRHAAAEVDAAHSAAATAANNDPNRVASGEVLSRMLEDDSAGSGEVKARISGRKKTAHREFKRVERNYYPPV